MTARQGNPDALAALRIKEQAGQDVDGQSALVVNTTEGKQVQIRPVSQTLLQKVGAAIRAEYVARGEPIDPPTYTVTTASGATETYVHDKESLSTDEERANWTAHQDALSRMEREINEKNARIILLKGLICEDPTPEWIEEQQWLGLTVSDDPRERKIAYIEDEVLKTPEDLIRVESRIMQVSMAGLPAEEIEAIEALFRSALANASVGQFIPSQG